MSKKILILNSDSPNNRGDRAILEGNLKLVRQKWPSAEIWALSEHPERDEKWYGINFLPYSAYTTSPIGLAKIAWFSRKCSVILWGGGEILKDYTNQIGIVYWLVRIASVKLFNREIYGAFQGIGPTKSKSSKFLIKLAVNMTRVFYTRDDESKQKLLDWGVKTQVVSSYDPAILNRVVEFDTGTQNHLKERFDITPEFLENSVGVGLRRWFHYKKGGLIPFRYRFWESKKQTSNPDLEAYTTNTARLLDEIIEKHDVNVVFFPMFNSPSEGDDAFSRSVASQMKHASRTRMISEDTLSPQQYLDVIARCRFFIAARLHSSIVAASAGVPAIVFYYVDKGRLFFEQLKMTRFSQPIDSLLDASYLPNVHEQVDEIVAERETISKETLERISEMSQKIQNDFDRTHR